MPPPTIVFVVHDALPAISHCGVPIFQACPLMRMSHFTPSFLTASMESNASRTRHEERDLRGRRSPLV
jgi:hypothetical protein